MKYLFINVVAGNGSTGRIAADQCRELQAQGHECVLAYGRWESNCSDVTTYRIGTTLDCRVHGLLTRLFDLHGFGSSRATRKFLRWVQNYDPDVIWLHNLHGYYLNIELLFDYLKTCGKPVCWTLHDCWAFTGHCSHFSYVGCEQWKTECTTCVQKKEYPKCIGISDVHRNFVRKKRAFTGVPDMTLITPSQWLADRVRQSFLKEYPVEVVYNKIDTSVFKATPGNFRNKYGLQNKIIVLGVASVWNERKGIKVFGELAHCLGAQYALVMVGLTERQKELFSSYYIYDLSLSEISEPEGKTRQSVSDAIRKVKDKLEKYEKVLRIREKNEALCALAEKVGSTDRELSAKILEIIGK